MPDKPSWLDYLSQPPSPDYPTFTHTIPALRHLFVRLPSDPRCRLCAAPFSGIGGKLLSPFGFRPSLISPNLCARCDVVARHVGGGTEVESTLLFADIRGSTTIAEDLTPTEFSHLINRFYKETTKVLVEADALIDKLVGDEVTAFWVPGFAGTDHPVKAVQAAQDLLRVTGHSNPEGPWVPVGIGLHFGESYVGVVGEEGGMRDMTILGDNVNIAARLASIALAGEIIISEDACQAAQLDTATLEKKELSLKGKIKPIIVRVIKVSP